MTRRVGKPVSLSVALTLGSVVGCSNRADEDVTFPKTSSVLTEATAFRFGPVINKPGRWLSHTYSLVNHLDHDFEIVDVVNQKPCCGTVSFQRTRLRPGDRGEVQIRLAVGGRIGDVSHQAEVVTTPPMPQPIRLRTEADAIPEARVEELDPISHALLVSDPEARIAHYRLTVMGTPDEPPIDLDAVEIRSSVDAHWAKPQTRSKDDRGLDVNAREWDAPMATTGEPGPRAAEVLFLRMGQPLLGHKFSWEVVRPIEPTPKMLVLHPGTTSYRIILRSRDGQAFRVEGATSDLALLETEPFVTTTGLVQTVAFRDKASTPRDPSTGKVTLRTSHPAAVTIEIPVHVLP